MVVKLNLTMSKYMSVMIFRWSFDQKFSYGNWADVLFSILWLIILMMWLKKPFLTPLSSKPGSLKQILQSLKSIEHPEIVGRWKNELKGKDPGVD